MRYFLAVAEELNFRKAAERLHVSQPTLSTQIRQLEEEMEVQLLKRDTHSVSLTPAGHHFQEHVRDILRHTDDAQRQARRMARGETGELSIGFVASLGHGLLPNVLRAYRKRFPEVELRLTQMDTTQQIEDLANRRLDLGFIGLGLSAEVSDLQLATVADERLMAVFPQDHPLTRKNGRLRKNIALAELAHEPFLFASRKGAPLFNPWLIVLCQQAGFQPEVIREDGQPVTVMNYVAAGLGVTILPAQFGRMSMTGVTFVPLALPVPSYRYCAAWSPHNPHSALAHFVEIAAKLFGR